jgi:TonB family protein
MKNPLNNLAKTIALVTLAAFCTTGYAQNNDLAAGDAPTNTTLPKENAGAGIVMPEFPGGEVGLSKYIEENLKYPENAKKDSLSRKVFVQFVINAEGKVENVKIARSVDQALDKEAIRVVKSMPKWEPAKQFGKPVKFTHTIAVEFK